MGRFVVVWKSLPVWNGLTSDSLLSADEIDRRSERDSTESIKDIGCTPPMCICMYREYKYTLSQSIGIESRDMLD